MKYSKLDCGMKATVSGSKYTGSGPLAAFLRCLVKKLSSFSVTFLFKGFGGGGIVCGGVRCWVRSSWLASVAKELRGVRCIRDWIIKDSEVSLGDYGWIGTGVLIGLVTTPPHQCSYCLLWGLIPLTVLFSPKTHSNGGKGLYTLKGGHFS